MGGTSRISREAYVRFCERLGVQFPGPTRRPRGGKEAPEHGNVRGQDGGDTELHNRINETRADSKTGAGDAAGGIDNARPSHRHRLAARAYRCTCKDGATGIDRQTADQYASNLAVNLRSLLERAKSGSYVAPPVRRVHIPKAGDGSQTRPIGIPTFEDKVLQRAVAMVLEAVYEQSFLDCSYGFRAGRSAHQALRVVQGQTVKMAGKWVLEVDIRNFFGTLDHCHLRNIVRKRVCDGVLLRLIGKWLNAGVMEDGAIQYPDAGTPQGGVVSPILANAYLDEVLDEWFAREVVPRLAGRAILVRYADDCAPRRRGKEALMGT